MEKIYLRNDTIKALEQLFGEKIEEAYIERSALVARTDKGEVKVVRAPGLIEEIQKGILSEIVEKSLSFLSEKEKEKIKEDILRNGIKGYIKAAEYLALAIQSRLLKSNAPDIYSVDVIKEAILYYGFERAEEILEALYSENSRKAYQLLKNSIEILSILNYKSQL